MGQGTVCGKMEVAVAMTQYMFACVVVSGAGDNEHCIVLCGGRRVCKKNRWCGYVCMYVATWWKVEWEKEQYVVQWK